MRKITLLVVALLLSFGASLHADEGMWLLSFLKDKNIKTMQEKGFKLSAEDIYSVNQNCIKDAIVGLGNEGRPFRHFCSGEIISDKGLFLTNHHCGFGSIQAHSSVDHDYLKDGFWAYSMDQELANPGITASILVRMEDVTDLIVPKLKDKMSEKEREAKINKIAKKIEAKAEKGTQYSANVKSMFNGNQFFLFVYVIYKDVRLVGAPPSSMGKFGGDTDNWMWPRHTADFSMFRIYTAPDGSPAAYSENNVPLKPKHHLPISIKGVKEGDYAMVMGFPGTTNRFLTTFGLQKTMDVTNKLVYNVRTVKLDKMREQMYKSDEVRIKYASKYARSSNYWKYSNQQNKALRKLNTMGAKQRIEDNLKAWVAQDPAREKKFGNALKLVEEYYQANKPFAELDTYIREALISGPEAPMNGKKLDKLYKLMTAKKVDQKKIDEYVEQLKKGVEEGYKDYDLTTDKSVMIGLYEYYKNNAPEMPSFYEIIENDYKGSVKLFADDFYKTSITASKENALAFLANPTKEAIENDLAYKVSNSIMDFYKSIAKKYTKLDEVEKGMRLYTQAVLEMNADKFMAPDANSTLRLTYGDIHGYSPADAVKYNFFTTINGVIEKEDATNPEFVVPSRLKELYALRDFGRYAENGKLHTCFLSNNDITGGNSGSPVMNAEGQLIGTAFDGNSEAMSGDIDFEENLQRCINLDVRYTLWIIDKFAGAKNLIDEMTIVE